MRYILIVIAMLAPAMWLAQPLPASAASSAGISSSVAGHSVRADFNGDGRADLAVGVPLEDFATGITNDGGVNVIYGSAGSEEGRGRQEWSEESGGMFGEPK